LTPLHFDAEKKKRDLDAKVAERKSQELSKQAADARQREDDLVRKEADDRARLDKLREAWKDKSAEAKLAAAEITRLVAACKQSLRAADPAALRQEYAAKQSEDTSVAAAIKAGKREIGQTETDVDRQQQQLSATDKELTEITGKLNLEESSRKQSAQTIDQMK